MKKVEWVFVGAGDIANSHVAGALCTIETTVITDAIFKSAQSGKMEPVIWEKNKC